MEQGAFMPLVALPHTVNVSSRCARWPSRKGIPRKPNRRGPLSMLPEDAEESLRDWELGRQQVEHPVSRHDLLEKAQHVAQLVCGLSVEEGWLRRYLERHSSLTLRTSQPLSKCRNEVDRKSVV